jgi:hypothetical protein
MTPCQAVGSRNVANGDPCVNTPASLFVCRDSSTAAGTAAAAAAAAAGAAAVAAGSEEAGARPASAASKPGESAADTSSIPTSSNGCNSTFARKRCNAPATYHVHWARTLRVSTAWWAAQGIRLLQPASTMPAKLPAVCLRALRSGDFPHRRPSQACGQAGRRSGRAQAGGQGGRCRVQPGARPRAAQAQPR